MAFLSHDLPQSRIALFLEHSLASIQTGLKKRKLYKTTFNELNALSGRELADLGIIRSDIPRIARETVDLS